MDGSLLFSCVYDMICPVEKGLKQFSFLNYWSSHSKNPAVTLCICEIKDVPLLNLVISELWGKIPEAASFGITFVANFWMDPFSLLMCMI